MLVACFADMRKSWVVYVLVLTGFILSPQDKHILVQREVSMYTKCSNFLRDICVICLHYPSLAVSSFCECPERGGERRYLWLRVHPSSVRMISVGSHLDNWQDRVHGTDF